MSEFLSPFMSVKEVAALLGVKPERTYRLIRNGEIPCVVVGGKKRIPREAWRRWLDSKVADALEAK